MVTVARRRVSIALVALMSVFFLAAQSASAVNVVAEDQVVQGSQCVGLGCVPAEAFGFDTLRLKEDNTRIAFSDTSSSVGFPTNDWELRANEQGSGGADMFGIVDATAGRIPLFLEAGAPNNALRLDSTGNIGLGTDNPSLDLHLNTGDTPAIRLEQNNLGGFTAQTWDVGANEANFFVRDLTGGSRLPFRIRPGAPTSSVDIAANGNVGVNTASPDAALQVERGNGTAKILVTENGGSGNQTLLDLQGQTSALAHFGATVSGADWTAGAGQSGGFQIGNAGGTQLGIDPSGELAASGSIGQLADAADLENVNAANPTALMQGLRSLPISTFEYTDDGTNRLHVGPTAADFASGLGLGGGSYVGVGDLASVALVAAKQLDGRVSSLEAGTGGGNSALEARVASLEKRLAAANKSAKKANKTAKKALKAVKKLKK